MGMREVQIRNPLGGEGFYQAVEELAVARVLLLSDALVAFCVELGAMEDLRKPVVGGTAFFDLVGVKSPSGGTRRGRPAFLFARGSPVAYPTPPFSAD